MIPADLLVRLQKADQATWEKIARGIPLKPCGQYFTYVEGKPSVHQFKDAYIPFGELMPEVALAWLQACIQAAIQARPGWGYQISAFGLPIIANVYNRQDYVAGRGSTEAEALGWAYLEAIEAVKG